MEMRFADGVFVVDRAYAGPLRSVCNDQPERFPFKDAMKMVGPYFGKQFIRTQFDGFVREHMARYGADE